jgi:hypothetical protein
MRRKGGDWRSKRETESLKKRKIQLRVRKEESLMRTETYEKKTRWFEQRGNRVQERERKDEKRADHKSLSLFCLFRLNDRGAVRLIIVESGGFAGAVGGCIGRRRVIRRTVGGGSGGLIGR